MRRLSSNLTIILRMFIPLVYIVFFGCVIAGSFLITVNDSPFLANPVIRFGMLGTYILFITLAYFTFMKLKRVDANDEHIIVSNYFKTFRYTWDSIKKMTTINLILFDIIYIHYHEKTAFGKRVFFLASRALVKSFFVDNPELFKYIDPNEAPK